MIQFEQVSFTYPGCTHPALRDISLEFKPGERIAVAGANGSGKTTLVLLLAGLVTPSKGEIRIDGQPVTKVPQGMAALAFQNPDDQMVASIVEKEIAFGLELQNKPQSEMERTTAATLARFGIERLSRREVQTLSGGEKQKVALGGLTIVDPRVLILDEPDSFLDAEGKSALESALKTLRAENPDLVEIRVAQEIETMRRSDRLLILNNGGVAADGRAIDLLEDRQLLADAGLIMQSADNGSRSALGPALPPANGDVQLLIENLQFNYQGGPTIIRNLNLSMKAGEIVGLAGATGSGKSTVGYLICGLLKPTSGTVSFKQAGRVADNTRMATMALQQPERQFFLPTCAAEIAFGPKSRGELLTDDKIDQLLELAGLSAETFRDRDPLTLSVGEQRRLAFAVLLALQRPFVIFDEPTAGLDARGVACFESLVKRLATDGTGVMVISHDHELLERISSRRLTIPSDANRTK